MTNSPLDEAKRPAEVQVPSLRGPTRASLQAIEELLKRLQDGHTCDAAQVFRYALAAFTHTANNIDIPIAVQFIESPGNVRWRHVLHAIQTQQLSNIQSNALLVRSQELPNGNGDFECII